MSLWHKAILLVVGAVAVATEETQKFVKRAGEGVQARMDQEMEPGKEPKLIQRPTKA